MCRVGDDASRNKTYPYSAYIMLPLLRMFFCSFHGEKPMILNSRLNAVAFFCLSEKNMTKYCVKRCVKHDLE